MEAVSPSWIIVYLGLGAILLELFVGVETGFDLVLIGISLILGGLIGNFLNSWEVGVVVAIVASLSYIAFGRSFIKSKLSITTRLTNVDQLIGKEGRVIKTIDKGNAGQVKIGSEVWRAVGKSKHKKGSKVKIVSVEGVTLKVKNVV